MSYSPRTLPSSSSTSSLSSHSSEGAYYESSQESLYWQLGAETLLGDDNSLREVTMEIYQNPERFLNETKAIIVMCNVQRVAFGVLTCLFIGYGGFIGGVLSGFLTLASHDMYCLLDGLIEKIMQTREFTITSPRKFDQRKFVEFWYTTFHIGASHGIGVIKELITPAIESTIMIDLFKDNVFSWLDDLGERLHLGVTG